MAKRIFITGIAGFLGSHLAETYARKGWRVYGNDNFICSNKDRIEKVKNDLHNDGIHQLVYSEVDCCEPRFKTLMAAFKPDVLVHAAATAHEGLSVFSPHEITRNIFEASTSVFSAAIATHIPRIIYCSSMARYGEGHKSEHSCSCSNQNPVWGSPPFRESYWPNPKDPYGIAKVAAEDVLKTLSKVHDFEYTILVPHNIIGEGQTYDDPFRNVVAIMINRMLQGKQPVIYGDGEQTRCFSYIKDVLSCFEKVIEKDDALFNGSVINIGPDEGEVSINRLAQIIAEQIGMECKPIYLPGRPLEVKHATCSSDKARKLLGYETKYDLTHAIKTMIEDIKQRGPKPFKYWTRPEIVNDKTPATWLNDDFI